MKNREKVLQTIRRMVQDGKDKLQVPLYTVYVYSLPRNGLGWWCGGFKFLYNIGDNFFILNKNKCKHCYIYISPIFLKNGVDNFVCKD